MTEKQSNPTTCQCGRTLDPIPGSHIYATERELWRRLRRLLLLCGIAALSSLYGLLTSCTHIGA